MAANKYIKLIALIILVAALAVFWQKPFMAPLKILVVYLHEISHAIGAVLSGGDVRMINISLNESGFTSTHGGNFLAIAGSGYLGSIIIGSLMLNAGLSGRFVRSVSWGVGVLLILFTLIVPEKLPRLAMIFGLAWGGGFILTVILFHHINRLILFFMGGLTSLYALYDLMDFFRSDITQTDAGLIAMRYFSQSSLLLPVAYLIAAIIAIISIWIQYRITMHGLQDTPEEIETPANQPGDLLSQTMANLPPEMALQLAEIIAHARANEAGRLEK